MGRSSDRSSEDKRTRGTNALSRPEPSKEEKPSLLVVCEGKNTEPSYFRKFKLSSATIKIVGTGYNTVSLVQKANELAQERDYDQVWCVFDKDDFSSEQFNKAIEAAVKDGFYCAYSNQAFEYWMILHFNDHQGGKMNRRHYHKMINQHLTPHNLKYDGNRSKRISDELFELMLDTDAKQGKRRIELAMDRASRNDKWHKDMPPADRQSTTTVFKLVEEILKHVDII